MTLAPVVSPGALSSIGGQVRCAQPEARALAVESSAPVGPTSTALPLTWWDCSGLDTYWRVG